LIKQTDPEGKNVQYEYDNEGRLIRTIDGSGNVIEMEYDDTGAAGCFSCGGGGSSQPSRIIYPTFTREFVYDIRGRKIEGRDVLSEGEIYTTTYEYDPAGNLISQTDKESKTTYYDYDSLNRLKRVIDPLFNETFYTYDARDSLIRLEDANNNATHFTYDRNNRLISETRPMGQATHYQYDGVGNLVQKIDAKNQKAGYAYDDAGRLIGIEYFNSADHVNPVKNVFFTYDNVGNLKTYDDNTTSAQYFYDDAYRKTSESVDYGTFTLSYWYTYYKNGLRKTFTGQNGISYQYNYNANNHLSAIQIPGVGSITYPEYNWNRPKKVVLPGGSIKEYGIYFGQTSSLSLLRHSAFLPVSPRHKASTSFCRLYIRQNQKPVSFMRVSPLRKRVKLSRKSLSPLGMVPLPALEE